MLSESAKSIADAVEILEKIERDLRKLYDEGIYDGEGNVMRLAAAKAGLTIRFDSEDSFPFFKDKIEQVRVKAGQSNLADKQIYFQMHKEIEFPKRPILRKIVDKINRKVVFFYRLLKLRFFNQNYDLQELL